jgi:hypothetical protein
MDYQFAAKFVKVFEKIDKYNHFDSDLSLLSSNPIINMDYVNSHSERAWCWRGLTSNPSIPLAYIEKHPEKPWNKDEYEIRKYGGEEIQPSIHITAINANGVPQCWSASNVSLELIEKQIDHIEAQLVMEDDDSYYYIWSDISDNPNLTIEFIDKYYKKPWNYYGLASNPLTADKERFKKEYAAAYIIQQAYARAKYIPTYAYCRKLHLQFYHSMFSQ